MSDYECNTLVSSFYRFCRSGVMSPDTCTPKPYYEDDSCVIYHGDCREILPWLHSRASELLDVVITDPPYGISYVSPLTPRDAIVGDADQTAVEWLFSFWHGDIEMCVFGANNFPHLLPYGGRWICWDKRLSEDADRMLGSPFELAWTTRDSGFDRMFRVLHGGVVNDNGPNLKRLHPTEKPVRLMRHVIQMFPGRGTVIDPFMGSGTTLRAAKDLGRKAIGIEIEEKYCAIAAKRLAQEVLAL